MPPRSIEDLQGWAEDVLCAAGLSEQAAAPVAASLAFADRRGVHTHGVLRLGRYVSRIQAGGINRSARPRNDADLGALVVVDADDGPGASSGVYGADLAVERATRFGAACVVVRNANHFGASAFYTNRMADAGMVGLTLCNTESVMCAPFGGRPVLGTNPIAMAVPGPPETRPQLDMATTTVSQGKLIMASQAGQQIPEGWAVDHDGASTTSPEDGLAGALLPSGGPKGFGLAFLVDALLAVGGANLSPQVHALGGDPARPQRLGQLFLALRADAAGSVRDYVDRVADLVRAVHESGTDGQSPLAPGEPELERSRALDGTLSLSGEVLEELTSLAERFAVPLPGPLARAS